ncbi:MAG: lantibiotic dehydratase family protein, partial [Pedobacter sp.]|nr:lantibiotic dehydratase family protein [Pedobacter sp.]
MKLTICPVTLCRTPVFSSQAQIDEVWEDLKTYIEESSTAFFEIIKDLAADQLALLDTKARFTLWKYFNRAKFRATPYGKFAAFSLVPVSKDESFNGIKIAKEAMIHRFADWSEKENINLDPSSLLKNASYLRTNTTAYVCGDELRYVNVMEGTFELSAITNQELAATVIRFCHIPRTVKEVQDLLHAEGMSKSTANYFIE